MESGKKWIAAFILLYIATTSVNKYVLSVLQFQYPTIFQGWQTLVGVVLLRILTMAGIIELDILSINRSVIGVWMPMMILFVCSIYSGSVALSQLPVPVFLSLLNMVTTFSTIIDVALHQQLMSLWQYVLVLITWVSIIMIAATDPEFSSGGYIWMTVHIVTLGLMMLYSRISSHKITLGEMEKIYCNYLYSVVVLAPCSYFLGDATAAREFPFWYYYKFYVGCVLSGIFGVLLSISTFKVTEKTGVTEEQIQGTAKSLTSLLSLLFFPFTITASNIFWILVNLAAGPLLAEVKASNQMSAPQNQNGSKPAANVTFHDTV